MMALFAILAGLPACVAAGAQSSPNPAVEITLTQAETIALANQPRLLAAQLRARSYAERVRGARAGYFPTVVFNATGVRVADAGTSTAAGAITTSAISDRFAYGGNLAQLVTDFGRTSALVESARAAAEAQADVATLTRAQVRLNVREVYYQVLGAEGGASRSKGSLGQSCPHFTSAFGVSTERIAIDAGCELREGT